MQFARDPVEFFGGSGSRAHAVSASEAEALQQEAVAFRLGQMLPVIPPLAALADAQGLDVFVPLDQVPRLLFPHTIYKSYDPVWLAERDFSALTDWATKFVAVDSSNIADDASGAPPTTADEWLDWLEQALAIAVVHSSGTSGRLSLVPARVEARLAHQRRLRMVRTELLASHGLGEAEMRMSVIWPAPARGRSALVYAGRMWREFEQLAPHEFATLFDEAPGLDYELYVTMARREAARGMLELPPPSPDVERMLEVAEYRHSHFGEFVDAMLDRVEAAMAGRRAILMGAPHVQAVIARAALARGMERFFAPHSFVQSMGGLKGRAMPNDGEAAIRRFMGDAQEIGIYGMTEMMLAATRCRHGRFHMPPWVIAWALDPTQDWAPLPRSGVREGRAAFLDLSVEGSWGGLISADHVVIDYGPCACGRRTPSVDARIRRVADDDRDTGFTPATPQAMAAALEALGVREPA